MSAARPSKGIWLQGLSQMPFMAGPHGAQRLRELRPILLQAQQEARERRARVLRHPWASAHLCAILHLSRAEQWNGYVPPEHDADERPNDSLARSALVELLRDVDELDRVPVGAGV
jgi:hypothetical protein